LTFKPVQEPPLIDDLEGGSYKYCKNHARDVCNWVLENDDPNTYCSACQFNRTIPDLSDQENFERWKQLEIAKHRLIYQLQKMGLSLLNKKTNDNGLCFDFVSKKGNNELMTGHANGVITILVQEADSVLREQMRKQFLEPYRTLIGHLRHEVGHYFWDRLIKNDPKKLEEFRSLFGDEKDNYSDALKAYYKSGAPIDWQQCYISKYATSHPWEDWAETWAHYLHIMDMVETAYFFGVDVKPKKLIKKIKTKVSFDPYTEEKFETIINICVPLSFAVNSINRAMGVPDVYPFVITPAVIEKLKFIHQLVLPNRL
ncbi:MAG: hypothetical protein HKN90_05370, partial [Flavobacteriaceae bacterium]|nr:hypothetical protein [Flavobacteriaceae bacterium]